MKVLKNIKKVLNESYSNKRISVEEYFISLAYIASSRSTCSRRKVGAVLVDSSNRTLSTGYNGNAPGVKHCIEESCPGAECASGEGLDLCEAIHAEVNAIGSCHDLQAVHRCYTTTSPCIHCVKALLATSCQEIVFAEEYPHTESKKLWEKSGRKWIPISEFDKQVYGVRSKQRDMYFRGPASLETLLKIPGREGDVIENITEPNAKFITHFWKEDLDRNKREWVEVNEKRYTGGVIDA